MNDEREQRGVSLWEVIKSVSASMLGVQSSAAHERDFRHGKASQYIIVGVIATVLFILVVVGVVKLVMSLAGAP
ncbi:MAG: hypothetical protein AMS22_03410 [Thiotrichales bacterium SG8_50]|nr:MAG: hypothetical protein AMS22_03410 [Thiotrichales bacterium SG8_50]